MNENTAKLVEALRSGKYEQTQGHLKDNAGFCCLGVACDVSDLGDWKPVHDDRYMYMVHTVLGDLHKRDLADSALLPEPVKEWLGWAAIDGAFLDDEGEVNALTYLNDNGSTFGEIADVIEKNFDALVDGR